MLSRSCAVPRSKLTLALKMFACTHNVFTICLLFLVIIGTVFSSTEAENAINRIDNNEVGENNKKDDLNINDDFQLLRDKIGQEFLVDKVEVELYYETLCPYCRNFTNQELVPVIEKLGPHLNLSTYPFGNADMNKTDNGTTFECQHGEEECYGNKLDACALEHLRATLYQAVLFNACMMGPQFEEGSDDEAADKCGAEMSIDVEPIKKCAKGEEGTTLLAYYGVESKKASFSYVPFVKVNGRKCEEDNLLRVLCLLLKDPPPVCWK